MIHQVAANLYVGDDAVCLLPPSHIPEPVFAVPHATVHATKFPCHAKALGYRGSLPKEHPNYLVYERGQDLFLNLIDPEIPLFKHELFWAASEFIEKHILDMPVIIHCNSGQSRAPSLALVYLVAHGLTPCQREKYFDNDQWLLSQYEYYNPGKGITYYLREHWVELINGRPVAPAAA